MQFDGSKPGADEHRRVLSGVGDAISTACSINSAYDACSSGDGGGCARGIADTLLGNNQLYTIATTVYDIASMDYEAPGADGRANCQAYAGRR